MGSKWASSSVSSSESLPLSDDGYYSANAAGDIRMCKSVGR